MSEKGSPLVVRSLSHTRPSDAQEVKPNHGHGGWQQGYPSIYRCGDNGPKAGGRASGVMATPDDMAPGPSEAKNDASEMAHPTKSSKRTKEDRATAAAMMGPTLKLQMQRFYSLYEKWKRKAVERDEKENQKLYASKGKGQWHLMKQMANQGQAKPLIALKRKKRGGRGQPIGSITMDPTEIDFMSLIVR